MHKTLDRLVSILLHSNYSTCAHRGLPGFFCSLKKSSNLITWQSLQISCVKDTVVTDASMLHSLDMKEWKWVKKALGSSSLSNVG